LQFLCLFCSSWSIILISFCHIWVPKFCYVEWSLSVAKIMEGTPS
jgi:hypothetical protein